MTFRDLTVLSIENLRLKKFRAFLTASGIVIAIAAFVSMVSFGAGTQGNIEREYEKLGLFTTMQVYPKGSNRGNFNHGDRERRQSDTQDTVVYPQLDKAAMTKLAAIPGVNLVYPYDAFDLAITLGDSVQHTQAVALPTSAIKTKLFSGITHGTGFATDSARSIVISDVLAKKLGVSNLDSLIGKEIRVSLRVSMLDSGLTHLIRDKDDDPIARLKKIKLDSIWRSSEYRRKILTREANAAGKRFMNGVLRSQLNIIDTLTVCGIRETSPGAPVRMYSAIIPFATAQRFSSTGFSTNPVKLMSSIQSGTLFPEEDVDNGKTFTQVTLDLDPRVLNKAVRDSVDKLGFRTFSFAMEIEEIQKFFFYFDMALGVVGIIALFTASLGIINTMVMSISERRREIGILKSLGADDSDIWRLFLVESGVIGFFGTCGGIFFGWGLTRIVAVIAKHYLEKEGLPDFDPFALPFWLIGISFAFGVGISLLAGLYPAARAARVDPVTALRTE